jgi:hypothetical protein
MATAILFIGFGQAHDYSQPEKAFGWLTTEGIAYLKQQEGKYFERMEPLGLTAHGGDLRGAVVLFGERAKLDELRRTDEFEAFSMNLSRRFADVGVIPGVNWDGIQAVMKRNNISGSK